MYHPLKTHARKTFCQLWSKMYFFPRNTSQIVPLRQCNVFDSLRLFNFKSMCLATDIPKLSAIQKKKKNALNGYHGTDFWCTFDELWFLMWFLSIALCIRCVRKWACGRVRLHIRNMRDFPQAKLEREINARFLLNEHVDLYFLFDNFSENSILNNWEYN